VAELVKKDESPPFDGPAPRTKIRVSYSINNVGGQKIRVTMQEIGHGIPFAGITRHHKHNCPQIQCGMVSTKGL
jgi:hypothetical protein